jgi:hypothetical protein
MAGMQSRTPGQGRFDAVELCWSELFVLKSPTRFENTAAVGATHTSNSSSSSSLQSSHHQRSVVHQSRERVEVTFFGVAIRAFDAFTRAPFDAWVVLAPTTLRLEHQTVVRSGDDEQHRAAAGVASSSALAHSASSGQRVCLYSSADLQVHVDDPLRLRLTPNFLAWAIRFSDRILLALPTTSPAAEPQPATSVSSVQAPTSAVPPIQRIEDMPERVFFIDDFRSMRIDRVRLCVGSSVCNFLSVLISFFDDS